MDAPLDSVTALILCRSGCGSLVASSVDLIVVSLEDCRDLAGPESYVGMFVDVVVLVAVDVVVRSVK